MDGSRREEVVEVLGWNQSRRSGIMLRQYSNKWTRIDSSRLLLRIPIHPLSKSCIPSLLRLSQSGRVADASPNGKWLELAFKTIEAKIHRQLGSICSARFGAEPRIWLRSGLSPGRLNDFFGSRAVTWLFFSSCLYLNRTSCGILDLLPDGDSGNNLKCSCLLFVGRPCSTSLKLCWGFSESIFFGGWWSVWILDGERQCTQYHPDPFFPLRLLNRSTFLIEIHFYWWFPLS